MITQKRLKELLSYDCNTGEFKWINSRRRARAGAVAGYQNKAGYVQMILDGKFYYAHRLAWLYEFGKFPDKTIDHRDRVKSNNRISNLRDACAKVQAANTVFEPKNKNGLAGVEMTQDGKWRSLTMDASGKSVYRGVFNTKEAAHEEYVKQKMRRNAYILGEVVASCEFGL
jgi:hypothetical protein